jgi:hypothetical protein
MKPTTYLFLLPILIMMESNHDSVVQKGTPVVRYKWYQIQITFKFRVLARKLCLVDDQFRDLRGESCVRDDFPSSKTRRFRNVVEPWITREI